MLSRKWIKILLILFHLHSSLLPNKATLSSTLLAPLAMGVALPQSIVPFLNFLKSLFLLIPPLNLPAPDFLFQQIHLFRLFFLLSTVHLPPLSLISSLISLLFLRTLALLTLN